MTSLDERYLDALKCLSSRLRGRSITWALTGSTSFVLQGLPLKPNDIDIQTTETGAYEIGELFSEQIVERISFSESDRIRSHFGAFELNDIRVEVMGAVQKRKPDGTWESPVDITEHRSFVDLGEVRVPVLSLEYEAEAYERLGRSERAALLTEHAEE